MKARLVFIDTTYDALGERFQLVRRVRLFHGPRLPFGRYIERPDVYDAWAEKRLRDWAHNPRWSHYAQTSIHLN